MINKIKEFLRDESQISANFTNSNARYSVLKYKYNTETIFIYISPTYGDAEFSFLDEFKFEGFYSFVTDTVYDIGFHLGELCGIPWENRNHIDNLVDEIGIKLNSLVEDMVNNKPVPITQGTKIIHSERDKQYYIERGAGKNARTKFYNHIAPSDITYRVDHTFELETSDIIQYINHPDDCLSRMAKWFIEKYAEDINHQLWCNELLRATLEELERKGGAHKIRRAIADCITNQGSVRVTLEKNGKEIEVSWSALSLKNDMFNEGSLFDYHIAASGRKLLPGFYGEKRPCIKVEDIKKIMYGKKTLYTRNLI